MPFPLLFLFEEISNKTVFFAIPSCNSVHTLTGFSKCKYPKTFGQTSKDCKN